MRKTAMTFDAANCKQNLRYNLLIKVMEDSRFYGLPMNYQIDATEKLYRYVINGYSKKGD